jgi:hypothetical protein
MEVWCFNNVYVFFLFNNSPKFIINWCWCHEANDKLAIKTKVVYAKRKMSKNSKNHAIIHSKIL